MSAQVLFSSTAIILPQYYKTLTPLENDWKDS